MRAGEHGLGNAARTGHLPCLRCYLFYRVSSASCRQREVRLRVNPAMADDKLFDSTRPESLSFTVVIVVTTCRTYGFMYYPLHPFGRV